MSTGNGPEASTRGALRGFGVDPAVHAYHFVVKMHPDESVTIAERFPDPVAEPTANAPVTEQPKARVTAYRWARIVEPVTQEFTSRLREEGGRPGRWLKRETPLTPWFGKELTLLAWAIEDADPTLLPVMIANWRGLAPEERWWFYTTINATAGSPDAGQDRGWRRAIKIAFTENPTELPPSALLVGPVEQPAAGGGRSIKRSAKPASENTQGRLRLFDDQ